MTLSRSRILFATDLSPRAALAADVAARFARSLHEPLLVLHVTAKPKPGAPTGSDERLAVLEHEVARLERIVDAALIVRPGEVVEAISANAESNHVRYVVVGAHGATARGLLGTIATALAAQSPTPILVVRAGERLLPFFSPNRKMPLRVVLAHARDQTLLAGRDVLVELSRIGPVDVTVLHALPARVDLAMQTKHEVERELRDSVGRLPCVDLRVVVTEGDESIESRLLTTIRRREPDLLICGTHQRRGSQRLLGGSIAGALVRDAPCSVIVAPIAAV